MGKDFQQFRQKQGGAPRRRQFVWIGTVVALVVASAIGFAVLAGRDDTPHRTSGSASSATSVASGAALPVVEVYKDPTCGCCSKWVEHLQAHGFTVRTTDRDDLTTFKADHGVPRQVQSCHTALVDGYVLEGHVPAADVERLLTERPGITGLAVAGMPVGSPGMEVPGVKPQQYDVVAFEKGAGTHVFATH